jgi:hypothetical protein
LNAIIDTLLVPVDRWNFIRDVPLYPSIHAGARSLGNTTPVVRVGAVDPTRIRAALVSTLTSRVLAARQVLLIAIAVLFARLITWKPIVDRPDR